MFKLSSSQREGATPEIADAVEFLASPRAAFISGTDLQVDGGLGAARISD
jgi:NAD(P)-dependent dehydrogenase (short-subunit alcohol dehydrogenase family)